MSQNYRVVFLFLALAFTLSACKVENLNDPIIVPLVDQEFSLDMWQTLGASTPSNLEIIIATIEDEPCLNTQILNDYDRTGRNIIITLYDILDPEVCDPGPAPALGLQRVSDATTDVYNLTIELQDVVSNSGTLTVSEEAYQVIMEEQNGISWLHDELRRIPEDALWGYVSYNNAAEENRVADFIAEITDLSTPLNLTKGYYGYFSVGNTGNLTSLNETPSSGEFTPLLVGYTSTFEMLDTKVEQFLAAPENENIELVLLDGKGNEWRN